jgi:predicted outer membrane repeat protein
LVISNSSVSGNSAELDRGGDISNQGGNASVEIYNSTFSGNSAGFGGGSIHSSGTAIIGVIDTILEAGKAGEIF